MSLKSEYRVIIIGCGIAGASAAYFLTQRGITDILILEKEEQPAYHATGRAAAVLVELDLVPSVLQLIVMGAQFLRNPPVGFSEQPLLRPSGILITFQGPLWQAVQQMIPAMRQMGVTVEPLAPREAVARIPVLSAENFDGAVNLPEDGSLDVHEILWSYLRHAKRSGALLLCNEEVLDIQTEGDRCSRVVTKHGQYACQWVINAAGAWAGKVRALAGPTPVKLTPYRRTIITFPAPPDLDVASWPLTADLSHELYFAPESAGLFASPMDQDPMAPCDVRPDDLMVARTIERLRRVAPELVPRTILRKWAGLRTFAPDEAMVIGEDPTIKGFFWLAGQGGSGIESSPAVGRIAADLIAEGHTELFDPGAVSPVRFGD
jgi:D-arginine dehydrogenase